MENLQKRVSKMKLIYTVAQDNDTGRWYVCKVGEENVQMSHSYKSKVTALHKAADMQEEPFSIYMKIRRRDLND